MQWFTQHVIGVTGHPLTPKYKPGPRSESFGLSLRVSVV